MDALFRRWLAGDRSALEVLLNAEQARLDWLAGRHGENSEALRTHVREAFEQHRGQILPTPSFRHWLFLIALKEIRTRASGHAGFDGLFETPAAEFVPTDNFGHELQKFMDAMTDESMEHYRLRFEDGLAFEEMAARLQPQPSPTPPPPLGFDWLSEWKNFLGV